MHRPCSSTSSRGVAAGRRERIAKRSSTSVRPACRNAIVMASGLSVAARWSPSTPLSAATIASRSAWGGWRGSAVSPTQGQPAEQRLGAAAHHPRDAAHRLVHQAGQAARALVGRWRGAPRQRGQAGDARVHRLHQAGQASHRVGGQASGAAQIGGLQERLGHGQVCQLPGLPRQRRRLTARRSSRSSDQYLIRTEAALRSASPWNTASMLLPSGSSTNAA